MSGPAAAADRARGDPWALRWARVHAALALPLCAALAALGLAGSPRLAPTSLDTRFFLVMLPAYLVATWLSVRGGTRSLEALSAVDGMRVDALRREIGRLSVGWRMGALALGALVHSSVLLFLGFDPVRPGAEGAVTWVAGWVHIAAFALTCGLQLRQGWLFLTLGRGVARVDLLDPARYAPFVQVALRLALLWGVLLALVLAFHVDWDTLRVAPQLVLILPCAFAVQVLLFLFPLWGIHERMRDRRRGELASVHAAIRGDRSALSGTLLARDARLSTVDLLQYRRQLEDFRTWPIETSALMRLLLYGGIPVLGWVGGALVERLVDLALGG